MADKFFGKLQDLRQTIRDDINSGKNPYKILLDVAKLLGEISGEDNYYSEIRDAVGSVYGYALKERDVLELELDEVTARREKIQAALSNENFSDDVKQRINFALKRHDEEIERLNSLIAAQKHLTAGV